MYIRPVYMEETAESLWGVCLVSVSLTAAHFTGTLEDACFIFGFLSEP